MGSELEIEPTVLVVEDEAGLADLYSVWLREYADVQTVNDGENALELLDDSIDVVLLDRRMPEVSGDAVLEALRDRDVDARVAIVSGVDPDFDIIDMGFDEYLTKPVSRDELRDAVERMVTRSEYDDCLQELLAAISKRAALESDYGPATVEDSEEYQELTDRIQQLREDADDLINEFDGSDFRVVFRDTLPDPSPQADGSPIELKSSQPAGE